MKHIAIKAVLLSAVCAATVCAAVLEVSAQDAAAYTPPAFTMEEKEYISSHSSLKVGYVQDRVPICFVGENGEAAGISRYIFDRVSEISGLDFEYVALPNGDVTYDFLQRERFDLVTSVEYNEENKNARGILISDPYLSSRKVIVAKENLEFRYGDDLSVAVSTGSQTLKKVLARMFPNFELKDYDSISACFDAVDIGDADLMIQNQYVVEYWLSKPKYESLSVIPMAGLEDQLCFSAVVDFQGTGEGRSQEEGEMLISILDKSIACLTEDETGSYIIQGVMENQYEYGFWDFLDRYRFSVIIFFVSVLVIIVMIIVIMKQRIRFAESKADAKAKGRFLSTMSHEIRTPLNGLIGLNYLMSQKIDNKEKMQEYLRQSSVTAKYLLSLVNDILDSSKLQEQKLELVKSPVDLSLVLDTVSSIEHNSIVKKNLDYSVDAEFICPIVNADEVRIQQVLLNLLDNARKFTQDGGRIKLTARQEQADNGRILTTVTVSDNGRGMSEEFQKKVFDVFSQELATVSKGNQGTGLGLSISSRLAKLMDGDLTCVSEKGKGSTFTFTFLAEPADAVKKKSDFRLSSDRLPHILVAEDNELNGEIMLELLRSEGFEADIAVNGKEALNMFTASKTGGYDVILMDLLMPEMDGFETAKAIRALDRPDAKTVKIFACTANSFTEEKDKAIASGMDDFLTKPVDIGVLLKKLDSAVSEND